MFGVFGEMVSRAFEVQTERFMAAVKVKMMGSVCVW